MQYRWVSWPTVVLLCLGYWFSLPRPLFRDPLSTVLVDRSGQLLGARIASDGQWRFPERDTVPFKFEQAIVEFEDHRFYRHLGVDPIGLGRALVQNLRNGKVVSGGSTISMQVIRLARGTGSRTVARKLVEMVLATRLEWGYSKKKILSLYAAHAPFGGNVVGLEAASWRYFGKDPAYLSWGEAATLAVLPNSPALIHPGRNREALLQKRNRLLERLHRRGVIDDLTYTLAAEEPLPAKPLPLPRIAPHLLDRAYLENERRTKDKQFFIQTTLDKPLQQQVERLLAYHLPLLKNNDINNLAALVLDTRTGEVLAYAGNAPETGAAHGAQVDVITAPRSTGSILKPFLYALALDEGLIGPSTFLLDSPSNFHGYRPENYSGKYEGVITAERSLIRSLNIPMVFLLQQYGLEKFHHKLTDMGLTTLYRPSHQYGLTLILGGAEASLWDLTSVYAGMARTLLHFHDRSGAYSRADFHPNYYTPMPAEEPVLTAHPPFLSASAIWSTFQAMQKLERPNVEGEWQQFHSRRKIAWKTGTSIGFRDAWAIGVTPDYVVGVWAGNADGEGRPNLVGIHAAAPILFSLFDILPASGWFERPADEQKAVPLCRISGYPPLEICDVDTFLLPSTAEALGPCPYHKRIHLTADQQYQVNSSCYPLEQMVHRTWFVLPPVEERYYLTRHPDYQPPPPWKPECREEYADLPFQLLYPKPNLAIFVPRDLDGQKGRTVFRAMHRHPETALHWHLDHTYLGTTRTFHEIELAPAPGEHILTVVDADGNRLQRSFEIIDRKTK